MSDGGGRGAGVRVLRDLIVIIAGVLVALTADTWWKGLEESAQEVDYLRSLESDLSSTVPQLRTAIERDSVGVAVNDRALETLYSHETPESFRVYFEFEDITIPTGTMRALIGAGDIRLIRATRLRAEILAFDALLDRSLSWRQSLESQSIENVREFFLYRETARLRNPAPPGMRSVSGALHSELRASPGAIAAVASHAMLLRNRVALHRELLVAVEELRDKIGDELGIRSD